MINRRDFLTTAGAAGLCAIAKSGHAMAGATKARIAITLDLEMSRNFPNWEDMHWDYEKGNLNQAAKEYSVAAAKRVKARGGRIHFFCVARVLEQPDIDWLKEIVAEGHPIGNHTYDHINLLATQTKDLQFRFQRSPWLIEGKSTADVIRENIHLARLALKQRVGIEHRGFRTPGGFANGLKDREDLQQILLDAGFRWVSSLYPPHANSEPGQKPTQAVLDDIVQAQSKAQPFTYPSGLIEIPMSPISDIGAFRNGRWKLDYFLEATRKSIEWTIQNRGVFDFLAHPSCLGVVDPEFKTIDLICDMVEQAGSQAELVDLDALAQGLGV